MNPFKFVFLLLPSFLASNIANGQVSVREKIETYRNAQDKPTDLGYRDIKMPSFPDLDSKYWFNVDQDNTVILKGKVVLVDFWDYTCVNCVRTLPYLKEWYERYKNDGLVIIGVHSPEFAFAKERENVSDAVERFGLKYPIVMDNDFEIWNRFGNRYWPAKYLFDKDGTLRYVHFGEGGYGNTEAMIQKLVKEISPAEELPVMMDPIRQTDVPGAVCYRTTPETYLGYERGSIANKEGYVHKEIVSYSEPNDFEKDKFYLVGKWDIEPQFVRYAGGGTGGKLVINYLGAEANLVIRPAAGTDPGPENRIPFKVYVYQDGKPIPREDWSADIQADSDGMTFVLVKDARMYYLTKNREYGRHLLTLQTSSDAFAAYAFTFVTACETN